MKITKIRYYRMNYEIEGFHYSINKEQDFDYCSLRCKETKMEYKIDFPFSMVYCMFFKRGSGIGATYNQQFDLNAIKIFTEQVIHGVPAKYTHAYADFLIENKRKKVIAAIESCIEKDLLIKIKTKDGNSIVINEKPNITLEMTKNSLHQLLLF